MSNDLQFRATRPAIRSVRPMTKSDLEALRQPSSRVRLLKLRDAHHIIARLSVLGLTNREIAAETGYSEARISIIKGAPAMIELIEKCCIFSTKFFDNHLDSLIIYYLLLYHDYL